MNGWLEKDQIPNIYNIFFDEPMKQFFPGCNRSPPTMYIFSNGSDPSISSEVLALVQSSDLLRFLLYYLTSDSLNFVVNTVPYYYCVYYEIL